MKNEYIKLSGTLCLITLVAAMLLAGVNEITKESIAKAELKASQDAMQMIIPEADEFNAISESVSEAKKGEEVVGYCVNTVTAGFGGDITMMVGFDKEDRILGIDILSNSETAGLGSKADGDDFKHQFKGKASDLSVIKVETDKENEIQAITGATVTSRAVADGIKLAKAELDNAKGGKK